MSFSQILILGIIIYCGLYYFKWRNKKKREEEFSKCSWGEKIDNLLQRILKLQGNIDKYTNTLWWARNSRSINFLLDLRGFLENFYEILENAKENQLNISSEKEKIFRYLRNTLRRAEMVEKASMIQGNAALMSFIGDIKLQIKDLYRLSNLL